jgi:cysteine-rich repeat protein
MIVGRKPFIIAAIGSLDSGEQCDDGNNLSGDGCSALCQSEISTYCGDGKIQSPNSYGIYEECENMPPNALAGDGCSARCLNEWHRLAVMGFYNIRTTLTLMSNLLCSC